MCGECSNQPPLAARHAQPSAALATTIAVLAILSMLFCCTAAGTGHDQSSRDVLDLLQGLNASTSPSSSSSSSSAHPSAHSTHSGLTPIGLRYTTGPDNRRTALLLDGESNRNIFLPDTVVSKALRLLRNHREVTFLCAVRQEVGDSGTILALSSDIDSSLYMEIESSGRRNEIRLHYSHQGQVRVETFPYGLADGQWHKLAVSLSGDQVKLFVDCNRIYQRVIPSIDPPPGGHNAATVSLFLGQRNRNQALVRGALQDVKIVTQAHGYVLQCPQEDTDCPTCANFQELEKRVKEMSAMYKELTHQLTRAEERLSDLEQCECLHYCYDNGTKRRDGEEWMRDKCNVCLCKNGSVECHTRECPAAQCKNPVYREGECCPVCLTNCYYSGKYYDHGQSTMPQVCVTCVCQNGRMRCEREAPEKTCPKLDCAPHERIEIHGQCCPVCNGTDFCGQGHTCHANASCINLATKSACQCHPGFDGDGHSCRDINECLETGGLKGHHCNSANTVCVNTPGSYRCDCKKGHNRLDSYECKDYDECLHGEHKCHAQAHCVNINGSYQCTCKEGYTGSGFECQPHCAGGCQNGGSCIAPHICECRDGYIGPNCELDINECELGISKCHGHSVCINMPGWYRCDCLEGYHSSWPDNHYGNLCWDINECDGEGDGHTCHPSMNCVNKDGGYVCQCKDPESCHKSCIFEGNEYSDGQSWKSRVDQCEHCRCEAGRAICHHRPCNCSDPHVDLSCCPSCDAENKCAHQEYALKHSSGDTWSYKCQTCECIHGETDCWPMECPAVACQNVIQRPGDCCPQCEDSNLCSSEMLELGGVDLSQTTCTYQGEDYIHGDGWHLESDPCTFCACKAGHICCTFDQTCSKPSYPMS